MSELAAALARVQARLPRIGKDEAAKVEHKGGGSHTIKYADLPAVSRALLPLLNAEGLVWTCWPTMEGGQFGLRYILVHPMDGVADERMEGFYPLPNSSPQTMGGSITYARRYCLLAVTGAAPDDEDDDAQQAQAEFLMDRQQRAEHNALRRGAVTGKVPGTERVTHVSEGGNEFYDTPPVDDTPVEDRHGTASAEQLRSIGIGFSRLGITDRDVALGMVSGWIGGQVIHSRKDLSFNQAAKVLAELGASK